MSEYVADKTTYWIAHGDGTLAFGVAATGQHIATGQPVFETFESYLPYRSRVMELGGTFEE
jgi:lysylphosphatidylglycerol synthetase-like protein (DUF2156 family)